MDLITLEKCLEKTYDTVVVGAGIVGTAMAYKLGDAGRKVLLVERDWSEPNRIVGELMQPGGVEALIKLGMQDCLNGIDSVEVQGYAVIAPKLGGSVVLPYKNIDRAGTVCTEETIRGASFHHGRFIQKLRAKASLKADCLCATVKELLLDSSGTVTGVRVTCKDVSAPVDITTNLVVVGDGCFSKFRGYTKNPYTVLKPHPFSHFVGLVLKSTDLPVPKHGHVVLAHPSPILLYQISSTETRILIDVPGSKPPSNDSGQLRQYIMADIVPQLPTRALRESLEAALNDSEQKLRVMPNGWLPTVRNSRAGLVVLGDAHNMRHPLTGGGMTVALWDVYFFAQELLAYKPKISKREYGIILSKFYVKRKGIASVVNILAQALYQLFAAGDDMYLSILRRGCFRTFELGSNWVQTPMALLSGLLHSPRALVVHFFKVAFYSIYAATSEAFYDLVEPFKRQTAIDKAEGFANTHNDLMVYSLYPIISIYMIAVFLCFTVITFQKACRVILPFIYHELIY